MSFTKASPGTWWNFEALGGHASEPWAKAAIVWQSGLFISMATCILQVLAGEVQERKAQRCDQDVPLFRENEMLIFVGMSLGRLLRPFELFMEELLSWNKLRGHVDLEGVTMTLVSCRQPNDTTGPTLKHALLARHPRQSRGSAWTMGIGESQITTGYP